MTDAKVVKLQEALTERVVSWYMLFSLSLPCFVCARRANASMFVL